MRKYFRLILFLILVLFLFKTFPLSRSYWVTFFGPEDFVKIKGKPSIITRTFSIDEFHPPYMLHLRNGDEDGMNRVSSAMVWLNGKPLFKHSDFSEQVWGYDTEVQLTEPSTLKVMLKGKPGCKLTIWIEGTRSDPYEFHEVVVDTNGGTYYFPGITLEVPPGAVDEVTTIGTHLIQKEEAESAIQSYNLNPKHFLAAFEAIPHRLSLNEPIKVKLQSDSLVNSFCMPLHFTLDPEHGIYNYAYTNLTFNRQNGTVELLIDEFSTHAILGVELPVGVSTNLLSESELSKSDQPDWDGHSDCDTIETACRCGTFHVEEQSSHEIIDGECQMVIIEGSITYLDCEGVPPETWNLEEYDRGYIDVVIPDPIKTGNEYEFTATVINSQGQDVGGYSLRFTSLTPDIVEVLDEYSGLIKGIKCGEGRIKIEAGCGLEREVIVDIWSPVETVSINPPEASLEYEDTLPVEAILLDENDLPVEYEPVTWSSDNPNVANVISTGLRTALITAGNTEGEAVITAMAGCDVPGYAVITVTAPEVASVEIIPSEATISIGEILPLTVAVYDTNGDELHGFPIEWTIPEGIIAFDPINLTVRGIEPGTATLTATCEGQSATAMITVVTIVGHWRMHWFCPDEDILGWNIYESGRYCEGDYINDEGAIGNELECWENCNDEWGDWTLIDRYVELGIDWEEWGEWVTYTGTINDEYNYMSGTFIWDIPGYWGYDHLTGLDIWIPAQTITGNWYAIKISDTPFEDNDLPSISLPPVRLDL